MSQVDSIQQLGQVFVPLQLNGANELYYFILDTGAGMSAIEQSVAAKLRLPLFGQTELAGTAGVLQVPLVQIEKLTPLRRLHALPPLTHYGLVVTAQDLSQFKVPLSSTNIAEAGLLGNDYLRHFIVEIEFLPPALHLSRPTGGAPDGVDIERFIPMWLDANQIVRVRGRLDEWLEVELRVDSGAASLQGLDAGPYLNLTMANWNKLCEKHPEYNFYTRLTASGMGGQVELPVGRITSFELGPLRFENPSVVVQPEQGIFAQPDAVGFISLNLFESGRWLTFDYPMGRIYLP